jgi:hypothetical protein
VAAGCQSLGAGITLVKTATGHDYAALRACAESVKHKHAGKSWRPAIVANADTPFAYVIGAVDVLRGRSL